MIDPENADFLLACLKENFRYRDSFEKHRAGLEAWHRGMEKEKVESATFWAEIYNLPIERFTCLPFNVRGADGKRVLSAEEALAFLDPEKEIDTIEKPRRDYVLSRIFDWTGVKVLPTEEKYDPDCARLRVSLRLPEEDHRKYIRYPDSDAAADWRDARMFYLQKHLDLVGRFDKTPVSAKSAVPEVGGDPIPGIQPHERVLLVNTQKNRNQLIEEFKEFLDSIGKDTRKEARVRAERWQQLEVWRKRRARIPFENIAEGLRKKPSEKLENLTKRAKNHFYRAHEMTQGYPYQEREDQKDTHRRICANCPDKETYRCNPETCPDLLYHLDQEDKYQNELTIGISPEMPPEQVRAAIWDHFNSDSDIPSDE